ncbi:MAG: hypothetical protein JW781_08165 [Deltaproteobacteria bacterium]|nr:hypothetical protein [Candidatus Anaeroferrophillacea bacterium]
MEPPFYFSFIDFCRNGGSNLDDTRKLLEQTFGFPVELAIDDDGKPPVFAVRLSESGRIRLPGGGFATIPARFGDGEIRLLPLFVHETETPDARLLAYERSHIDQFLRRHGEYTNYREFILEAPDAASPPERKYALLCHVMRRVLINDREAFPLLHPDKEDKTLQALLIYQLAERISWYIGRLELDRQATVAALVPELEKIVAADPFYQTEPAGETVELFRQTMISLTLFL